MNISITILFSLLAVMTLTIGKAVLVSQLIRDGVYSYRNLATISVLFVAMTAKSISSQCGYLGCGWSLHFGWIPATLRSVFATNSMPDALINLLATAGYAVLCIYFFGHLLGWASYALSRTRNLIG